MFVTDVSRGTLARIGDSDDSYLSLDITDNGNESQAMLKRAASWENQQCGFRIGPTQTGLYKHRKRLES